MPKLSPSLLLPAIRIGIGAGDVAAPEVLGAAFGFDVNPESVYLARIFGADSLALGLGQVLARGEAKKLLYGVGILTDAIGVAAGVIGFQGGATKRGTGMATVLSATGVGLGIIALADAKKAAKAALAEAADAVGSPGENGGKQRRGRRRKQPGAVAA